MKASILSLAFLIVPGLTMSAENLSASTWVDTNVVYISSNVSPDQARVDCETATRILNIMSNDKVAFRSICQPVYNRPCVYQYCYQLTPKVLVIDQKDQHNEAE